MTMKAVVQYWDREQNRAITVTHETPLPTKLNPGLLSSVEPIADPSSATVEDVANAYNKLLAALRG